MKKIYKKRMHYVQPSHQRTFVNYKNFDLQIEKLSAFQRTMCRSQLSLQIEELSPCKTRNYVQIK